MSTYIKDFKGRFYTVLEINKKSTLLQSVKTATQPTIERIRVKNTEWQSMGLIANKGIN